MLFFFLKQVKRLQTTTMPTWSTAIVQTSKWPTRNKHFHTRRLVSYLLINNSYNVVAIELQLMIAFSRISCKTATKLYQCLLYMEIANPFFLQAAWRENTFLESATWNFSRLQCSMWALLSSVAIVFTSETRKMLNSIL